MGKLRSASKKDCLVLLKTVKLILLSVILATTTFVLVNVSPAVVSKALPISVPTLTAAITTPTTGAVFPVGQCYSVSATITVRRAPVILMESSPFIKIVHATTLGTGVHNLKGIISVSGNASIQGSPTINIPDMVLSPDGSGNYTATATVNWQVCCTGPGSVTITVTPSGDYECLFTESNGLFASLIQPVYADITEYCPIPNANLFSHSITVSQVGIPINQNNNGDSGNPLNFIPTGPNIVLLTANVQSGQVASGQPVTIYANAANRGDTEGSFTAVLKINGVEEATKTISLKGNTGTPLEFTVKRTLPGTYTVDINGRQTYFTIAESSKETALNSSQGLILIIVGVLVLIVAIMLSVFFIRRRESSF